MAGYVKTAVLGLLMTFTSFYVTNDIRKRFLEDLMLKIDEIKPDFAQETFDNFGVFRFVMNQNLSRNEKFRNRRKLVPESSRVCFSYFFEINGAKHSPQLSDWVALRMKNQVQHKFSSTIYLTPILYIHL